MARPSARVLLENIDDLRTSIAVCEADTVYAVTYRGQPIQVRKHHNVDVDYPGPKYLKTTYVNSGHAFNLAERLNSLFNTTDFAVAKTGPLKPIKRS